MASNSMGGGNGDLGCPSSGMATNPFFASGWDRVVSLGQHESLGGSSLVSQAEFGNSHYPDVMQNHAFSSSSHLIHYPLDPSFVRLPKLPSIGSGNFAEPGGPFGYTDCGDPFKDDRSNRSKDEGMQSCEEPQLSEETVAGASPAGSGRRRKRGPECDTNLRTSMNAVELQKGPFNVSSGYEHDEKISKTELNANNRGKQTVKQAKDTSQGEEAEKDSYIHVRARRGQATNSHSLAERVRREKISERMKALQDLVPGCNKITGKAVMLDEIINYVQSLQQQVEFLSMKLATVNPDVNVDIERILSKDILYSRGGNVATLGFSPGMNSLSQPHPNGIYSASMPLMSNANLLYPPLNQPMLDTELQGFLQTGFDPSSGMNSLGSNNGNHLIPPSNRLFAIELRSPTRDTLSCAGRLKPEL